jgi:hypothetical protein
MGFGPFEKQSSDDGIEQTARLLSSIKQIIGCLNDKGFPRKTRIMLIDALCDRVAMELGYNSIESIGSMGTLGENIKAIVGE